MTMMDNSITNNDLSSNVVVESNKERPTGLYQDLPWNDLKRHSSRLLQSRVGRDKQRYDGKIRLLACIVVSRRPVDSNENEFLLISSSKHPTQWILPKGGWENDESIVESALREANEEAGIAGDIWAHWVRSILPANRVILVASTVTSCKSKRCSKTGQRTLASANGSRSTKLVRCCSTDQSSLRWYRVLQHFDATEYMQVLQGALELVFNTRYSRTC